MSTRKASLGPQLLLFTLIIATVPIILSACGNSAAGYPNSAAGYPQLDSTYNGPYTENAGGTQGNGIVNISVLSEDQQGNLHMTIDYILQGDCSGNITTDGQITLQCAWNTADPHTSTVHAALFTDGHIEGTDTSSTETLTWSVTPGTV